MSRNTKVTPFFRNWKEAGDDETFRRIDASIANQLEKNPSFTDSRFILQEVLCNETKMQLELRKQIPALQPQTILDSELDLGRY